MITKFVWQLSLIGSSYTSTKEVPALDMKSKALCTTSTKSNGYPRWAIKSQSSSSSSQAAVGRPLSVNGNRLLILIWNHRECLCVWTKRSGLIFPLAAHTLIIMENSVCPPWAFARGISHSNSLTDSPLQIHPLFMSLFLSFTTVKRI